MDAVPPSVVTTTFTIPIAWAGVIAVIVVSLTTEKLIAFVPPKVNAVVPVKPVPLIVTAWPPAVGPEFGEMLVNVGVVVKVYMSADEVADVPLGVVTVISMVPATWAGAVAVICVALLTVNEVAAVPPKDTAVAPVKPVPVIITGVPPVIDPEVGETLVTTGAAM